MHPLQYAHCACAFRLFLLRSSFPCISFARAEAQLKDWKDWKMAWDELKWMYVFRSRQFSCSDCLCLNWRGVHKHGQLWSSTTALPLDILRCYPLLRKMHDKHKFSHNNAYAVYIYPIKFSMHAEMHPNKYERYLTSNGLPFIPERITLWVFGLARTTTTAIFLFDEFFNIKSAHIYRRQAGTQVRAPRSVLSLFRLCLDVRFVARECWVTRRTKQKYENVSVAEKFNVIFVFTCCLHCDLPYVVMHITANIRICIHFTLNPSRDKRFFALFASNGTVHAVCIYCVANVVREKIWIERNTLAHIYSIKFRFYGMSQSLSHTCESHSE